MAFESGHAHLIVFMHACSYYLRAATNQGAASIRYTCPLTLMHRAQHT